MQPHDSDLMLFAKWRKENDISNTTGYRLVKAGELKIVKIGRRTYITKTERERFVKSLSSTQSA